MKTENIKRDGCTFKAETRADGRVFLSYLGREGDFKQFIRWLCDDEAEAEDMINAVIAPDRCADDEYKARHSEKVLSSCKW